MRVKNKTLRGLFLTNFAQGFGQEVQSKSVKKRAFNLFNCQPATAYVSQVYVYKYSWALSTIKSFNTSLLSVLQSNIFYIPLGFKLVQLFCNHQAMQ